jgi:transcriptional regulator with XRE-family HTH domain
MSWPEVWAVSRILKTVGAHIRLLRKAQKLSQEKLAERSNLHYTMIGAVERGERNITLENLAKIAKGLGIPVRELFPPETRHKEVSRELVALLAVADQNTSDLIPHPFHCEAHPGKASRPARIESPVKRKLENLRRLSTNSRHANLFRPVIPS